MIQDLKINENLWYLDMTLHSLGYYKFDSDIIKLLNELKTLVDKKLYTNFNPEGHDIKEQYLVMHYLFEK